MASRRVCTRPNRVGPLVRSHSPMLTSAQRPWRSPTTTVPSRSRYSPRAGFLEGGIVWAVAGKTNSQQLSQPTDGDLCYTITISNVRIAGAEQTPYEYATCLLDLTAHS